MSHDPHAHFEQEPEHFHGPRITVIGIVTLVIFALAVVWAASIWKERTRDNQPTVPEQPHELGNAEIGLVDQVPFEQNFEAPELRIRKLQQLESYGWVNRAAGKVHVPIERAFELVLAEQKGTK
jgi:hypothetical protein